MPRIADALERESRTVDLERGDFERLLDRRERRQRNRRIRAGVLGVSVALVMGVILARSMMMSDPIPADPPVEPTPAPAPAAPGTLAYELDGDIYVADPDGSNAVKIANGLPDGEDCADHPGGGTYGAEGPMWSPDGRYLAYRYYDCSDPEIGGEISDAEGNVLATFPADGWEIAWSPDSTRVAVWDHFSYEPNDPPIIGVYGLDGARLAQLTMPAGWTPSGDHDPKWMPEGTSVWVDNLEVPLDGSTPRPLPGHGGDPYATYSPDGSLVAYSTNGSLMVARSDGSEPREVFDEASYGGDWGHPWSATGDRIAFATSGRGRAWWSAELRVVDVATGSVTLLTEGERGVSLHAIGFSPRGDRILFRRDEGRADSLWSIGIDGSDARLVVAGAWQGEWLSP
jgi:hypothetical protein